MIVAWFVRGYDKRTEFESVTYKLPEGLVPLARSLVQPASDDPDLCDPYELTAEAIGVLSGQLGVRIDPDAYDYFLESSDVSMVSAFGEALASVD